MINMIIADMVQIHAIKDGIVSILDTGIEPANNTLTFIRTMVSNNDCNANHRHYTSTTTIPSLNVQSSGTEYSGLNSPHYVTAYAS